MHESHKRNLQPIHDLDFRSDIPKSSATPQDLQTFTKTEILYTSSDFLLGYGDTR